VPPIPPITRNLLIALVIAFGLQNLLSWENFEAPFALWPLGDFNAGVGSDGVAFSVGFQPWQVLTYGFLHGNFMHLLFNGIGLWQFGSRVEQVLGTKRYLQFFFACVVGAGLCQLAVVTTMIGMGQPPFPTVGASGGIFGILLAYAMFFPRDRMIIIPIPVPISARTMVIIYGAISLLAGVTGTMQGVAHFAHLGGMLFGWLLLQYWGGKPPFRKKKRKPDLRRVF
jgi:membrane associated rhomboid family serine protease